MASQRVHVYSSTKPIGYENKFQYKVDMIPKFLTKCGYSDFKQAFIVKDNENYRLRMLRNNLGKQHLSYYY